jgi:hypothetical protein
MNANENMQKQLNRIQEELNDLKIAFALLPDLGEIDGCITELCFQADIPFSHEAVKDIQDRLTAAGWIETSRYNRDHAGDAVIVFTHPNANREFSVMLQPDWAGSTCKRNIVDYRHQPIYEIVCNEA